MIHCQLSKPPFTCWIRCIDYVIIYVVKFPHACGNLKVCATIRVEVILHVIS